MSCSVPNTVLMLGQPAMVIILTQKCVQCRSYTACQKVLLDKTKTGGNGARSGLASDLQLSGGRVAMALSHDLPSRPVQSWNLSRGSKAFIGVLRWVVSAIKRKQELVEKGLQGRTIQEPPS